MLFRSFTDYDLDLLYEENSDIIDDVYFEQTGTASYYGKKFHNRKTASGEIYNMLDFSAAHRNLPFGTILRVTNLETDKVTLVRVNDRGPFIRSRIIDLSYQAAQDIEGIGLAQVKIEGLNIRFLDAEKNSTYLLCYSIDEPLVCIPNNKADIIDSLDSFEDAFQLLREYSNQNFRTTVYLMVPVVSENDKIKLRNNKYYIASIENTFLKEMTTQSAIANISK